MATLIDDPGAEWNDNEVLLLEASDEIEGAGTGASYGGIGRDNQPHQQLANRTAFLKSRQDTNIANIANLILFMDGFSGSDADGGWLYIPYEDISISVGAARMLVQWGSLSVKQSGIYTLNFPQLFPNACRRCMVSLQYNSAAAPPAGIELITLNAPSRSQQQVALVGAPVSNVNLYTIQFLAIGR